MLRVKPEAKCHPAATLQFVAANLIAEKRSRCIQADNARLPSCRALRAGGYQRRQVRAFAPPHQELNASPNVVTTAASLAAAAAAIIAAGILGIVLRAIVHGDIHHGGIAGEP